MINVVFAFLYFQTSDMLQDNKMTTICPIYPIIENKSEKCLSAYVLDDDFGPGLVGSISSLEIGIKTIILYFLNLWRLTRWQMIKNLALITFIRTKIEKCLTSWILRKLVPGLKGLTWSRISIEFEKYIYLYIYKKRKQIVICIYKKSL